MTGPLKFLVSIVVLLLFVSDFTLRVNAMLHQTRISCITGWRWRTLCTFFTERRTRGSVQCSVAGNPGERWFLPGRLHDLRCRAGGEARWRDRLAPVEFPAHHVQPIDASLEGTGEASEKWRFL